jgi:hypothetical protein
MADWQAPVMPVAVALVGLMSASALALSIARAATVRDVAAAVWIIVPTIVAAILVLDLVHMAFF